MSSRTGRDLTGRDVKYDPDGAGPTCRHCGRPFAAEELLALHRGHAHPEALTAAERDAFETAYAAEQTRIRRFRLKAVGLVILLYFGLLMVYAVVV